jgi:glycosyltransferase involved in cell wall biosynthesis
MEMKIKVLHYLDNLDLGGTTKTCQLFFEHSSSTQFDSYVAYKADSDMTRLDEFVIASKVCDGQLIALDEEVILQDVIYKNSIDILHVYRSGFSQFPEPGLSIKVPHFVETNVFGHIDSNPRIDRTLYMSEWLMNYSMTQLNGISHSMPSRRFDFVNNPVESPASQLSLKLDIDDDAIILGRCGRPDNGIYNSVSVRAAHLLRMQGYPIHFLVVAPPSNMIDDLAKYDIPFHTISPTTSASVLSQFYNTVDIYAHARADGETFGVNIAEAMMHAKPVVTHWATPSFPGMGVFQSQTELVDDGKTGFVVDNDVGEYADALKKLIDDPKLRVSMGVEGARKAKEQYHAASCVKKLESIYREVISE